MKKYILCTFPRLGLAHAKSGRKMERIGDYRQGLAVHRVSNGVTTVNKAEDKTFASGYIGLQYGAGVVKFRKIEIKPI